MRSCSAISCHARAHARASSETVSTAWGGTDLMISCLLSIGT
ncbi:CxxxxCH/CxxCH domain-containing protein [Streptomyces sp. cg2]